MERKPILIIGGGISGITAAVEAAETGREVILVEKEPFLGGNVARMNNYFPKLCPPSCGLEINFRRIRKNRRIRVFTDTTVSSITGSAGNFRLGLFRKPQFISDNCTACGKCAEVCPVSKPDEFNYGFTLSKAVFLPYEMAFPTKFSIDGNTCLKEACGKCFCVCSYEAINLSATSEEIEVEASAIIIATGWSGYDASLIRELHFNECANIVSNLQFERLLSLAGKDYSKLTRPSDGKIVKNVVFVQCAGSRDENNLSYCSAVCCSASLKHAITLREMVPDSHAIIFYIDLRVSGRNEDFLRKAEENKGISLVKGKVASIEIDKESGDLIVVAEDILAGKKIKINADLVVLATGIVPNNPGINIRKGPEGFAFEQQMEGISVVSCARIPMDVSSSVKDATGAVLKAIQIL